MNDLIWRSDAIDAMMRLQKEDEESYGALIPEGFDGDRAADALKHLPSAEPDRYKEGWNDAIEAVIKIIKAEIGENNGNTTNAFKISRQGQPGADKTS